MATGSAPRAQLESFVPARQPMYFASSSSRAAASSRVFGLTTRAFSAAVWVLIRSLTRGSALMVFTQSAAAPPPLRR